MENNLVNKNEIKTKERGDSLELAIEHIFKVARFKTERNVFITGYEIDVKATIGDRTIVIECKNYQNSDLTIRNLIHQWNSKNNLIRAHKIILVLAGISIHDNDYALASSFDMELWNQNDISELFNLSLKPDELRKKLLSKISLKPLTISERYRDEITYLVIKPLLSNSIINEELLFWYLNKWLRSYILTELQMVDTNPDLRAKHIELFEGTKTKKGFLNITTKRKEFDYWNAVYIKLKNQEVLGKEQQKNYIFYMNDLLDEYQTQKLFFEKEDYLITTKRLITSRLQNAISFGEKCKFTLSQMQNSVIITPYETEVISIHITNITETQGNILNWILTSEFSKIIDGLTKENKFTWFCNSFIETVEKVFRIFTEYYSISENDSIRDLSIE